jgi:hypothetical protein
MVYVDELRPWGWMMYGRRVDSCHMLTDGAVEELHAMAAKLGLSRSYFQGPPKHAPHYDLVKSKRDQALALGACFVSGRSEQWIELLRHGRQLQRTG